MASGALAQMLARTFALRVRHTFPDWELCDPPPPEKMTRSDEPAVRLKGHVVAQYIHDDTNKHYRRVLCVDPLPGEPKLYWLEKRS